MNGLVGNLLNGLVEIWKTIGIPQKVSIILVLIVTFFAISGVVYLGAQPDWQILESGMTLETAAKVHGIAKDAGVNVKLVDSGRTIMVPSKEVYALRLKIAGEGIKISKDNKVGWDIFDKTNLAMTELQQQVAKQRAQQGELSSMISKMPGIVSADVILTMPKKMTFRRDSNSVKASVMLNMGQEMSISIAKANTIRHLVSSAITGLEPQNVNITDSNGRLLAKQMTAQEVADGGSASNQIEYKTKVEYKLQQKIIELLSPSVGMKNVLAQVSCDVNFDSSDEVTEDYDADKVLMISDDSVTETSSSAKKGGSGGVRTVAVDPNARNGSNNNNDSTSKTTYKKRYVIPKTVRKRSIKGGAITKITVAVAINKAIVSDTETLRIYKELVEEAISGASSVEKPVVIVRSIPFAEVKKAAWTPPVTDTIMASIERITNSPIVRPVIGAVLLLILFVMFKNYFNKTTVEGSEMNQGLYGNENSQIEDALDSQPLALEIEQNSIVTELGEKAGSSPEAVATIMENWLMQDA